MTGKLAFVLCSGLGILVVAAVAAFYLLRGPQEDETDRDETLQQPAVGFTGNSTELKRTVIVPTLDTPLPKDKNAIWCASFQLAWNQLAKDVVHGPPVVANAEEAAARLNSAKVTEADLPESACYAAAGFTADGIVEKIRSEMQERFGKQPKIELDSPGTAIVAYGYLRASVRFTMPFLDNDEHFFFQEPGGEETPVASFGIRHSDINRYERLREQVAVLHTSRREFVIDPCRTSSPNQLVLACLEPQETLAATWDEVRRRIKENPPNAHEREFGEGGILLIPNLDWDILHRFAELEGGDKRLNNPGFKSNWIDAAVQSIRFRLNRSGAELASESAAQVKSSIRVCVFDRPFLVAIRKRGCEQPFFVMWVANSELLLRK